MPTADSIVLEEGSFDAQVSKDGFTNVALLTGGVEIKGHGMYSDARTVETCLAAIGNSSVPSYLTHQGAIEDGQPADRLGKEIAFAKGIFRDGDKVRAASLKFLSSFGQYATETRDKLVELAKDYPEQLGMSLVAKFNRVWVFGDGAEQIADGGAKPAGAIRDLPSMRILAVASADVVRRPAINMGLFSARVDESGKGMANETIALSAHTAALATKESEVTAALGATHAAALSAKDAAHVVALAAKDTAHVVALAAKDAELATLKTSHTAALSVKDTEIAEVKKFDCRLIGTPEAAIVTAQVNGGAQLPAPAATDQLRWAQYSELLEKDAKLAAAFSAKYLAAK